MTDNEIIKALNVCKNNSLDPPCAKCPFVGERYCLEVLHKSTLDLINRQRAEIERLQGLAEEMVDNNEAWVRDNCELRNNLKTAKAEAIKEFAERLKEANFYEFIETYYDNAELNFEFRNDLFKDFVDNLVKEMTEEKEE